MTQIAYIALGSNMASPVQQVLQAIAAIRQLPRTRFLAHASLYRTPPWGITEQPDFINTVVKIQTDLPPEQLWQALSDIETAQERIRTVKNGPRTLDCDILLYGNQVIQTPVLTIPHPGLTTRPFVLVPLAEIAPALILPQGECIDTLLAQQDIRTIEKLSEEMNLCHHHPY
jgi:2-amino-4-hydroxy-6-hydroxymethyldihydropteridine diphosphokinase